ncbi:fimbrial protein [Buttiauxella selenatireducens]|uniref:Fimbrial protein n=1 Tax=Buttiauxella selenatireducens TaxID=3073902 RepID=A0ABY9SDK3_9ENTR|nr:fimbrial protein [Buttiauxella sp. R73]WMY75571.1 fimbrial protein [Buttiauxella sp. R73]
MCPLAAYASDDYTFNIKANLTTSSCTVNTENLTFNLYINAVDLQTAGSSSSWQELPGQVIKLSNCFGGTNSVDATVSGVMDDDDTDGFKNQSGASTPATGVSVQLKSGEQMLHNNDVITADIKPDHTVDIPLAARLYTAKGNVISGDVYSVINLTLSYK